MSNQNSQLNQQSSNGGDRFFEMAVELWCDPRCHSVPMYPELAVVVAEKFRELDAEYRVAIASMVEAHNKPKSLPELIREGREL